MRPSGDRVRRAAPYVDVLRVLIAVGALVSVFGGGVRVPPIPPGAEAMGDRGCVVDDLDLGNTGTYKAAGFVGILLSLLVNDIYRRIEERW